MTEQQLIERAKKHAVRVAQGSGVLIQPMSDEFSYVITAGHVVKEDSYPNIDQIEIYTESGTQILVLERFFHRDTSCDLAILQVEYQPDLEIGLFYNEVERGLGVTMYGYPHNERPEQGETQEISSYQLTVHDFREHGVIEFTNQSTALFEEIESYSGSGLYYFDEKKDCVQLLGIENSMKNSDTIDGHILGYNISKLQEIFQQYGLVEIAPPFLKSFRYHENNLFQLIELLDDNSINCVKDLAKCYFSSNNIHESKVINPESILNTFFEKLQTYKQVREDYFTPDIWQRFLEFVFVYILLNSDEFELLQDHRATLNEIFKKYRFVHDHEKLNYKKIWGRYIAYTNLDNIEPDAKILVFSDGAKEIVQLEEGLWKTVSNITDGSEQNLPIDRVGKNKKIKNPIFVWQGLSKCCIEDHEDDFRSLRVGDDFEKIAELVKQRFSEKLECETSDE